MDSFKPQKTIHLHTPSTVDEGKNRTEEMSCMMPSPASDNQMYSDMPVLQHHHDELDLVYSIKGMYRILDLITERGGGGLVDKIIISQNSVEAFINTVCPGAYVSVTKVNFKALDNYIIKPVGVYGSKEEIVRFLSELGVVDDAIATQLLVGTDTLGPTKPTLRSGLYIISNTEQACNTRQIFLLYCRNKERGTTLQLLQYLTKMCDQVVALISSEHAQTIIWNGDDRASDRHVVGVDHRESRMFTFEVAQTNEQEESVTVRDGFKAASDDIALPADPADGSTNPDPVKPFLLFGETAQGFMTVKDREAQRVSDVLEARTTYSSLELEGYLASDCLHISENIDDEALRILIGSGLEKRFPQECSQWKTAIRDQNTRLKASELSLTKAKLDEQSPNLGRSLHEAILNAVKQLYPCLDLWSFPHVAEPEEQAVESPGLTGVIAKCPEVNGLVVLEVQETFHNGITNDDFRTAKERICFAKELYSRLKEKLDKQTLDSVLQAALTGKPERVKDIMKPNAGSIKSNPKATFGALLLSGARSIYQSFFTNDADAALVDKHIQDATSAASRITDSNFSPNLIATLNVIQLSGKMKETEWKARINHECTSRAEEEMRKLRMCLVRRLNSLSGQAPHTHTFHISAAKKTKGSHRYGSRESQVDAMVTYTVHLMNLTTQDQHELQLHPTAIPSPRFKFTHSFKLRQGHSVIRAQLLDGEKLLLVVANPVGNLMIYLAGLAGMDGAIQHGRGKALNREKIGQDFILAYDESKRMLGVASSDKALGSPINLTAWYNEGSFIRHACFISGTEELLLVDSQAQARVFSLVTLQFRPATLNLERVPFSVSSTPDGSCLLVSQVRGSEMAVTAYHWDTFGSTEGIGLDISNLPIDENLVVTSLISGSTVHLLTLDFSARACYSYALGITRKTTEFMFKEKGHGGPDLRNGNTTAHNCLVDCHSDVWTHFPVLPAVQRETVSSSSLRSPKTIVFITDRDFAMFAPHFAEMIYKFGCSTQKPTGSVLKSIKVSAASFYVFSEELCNNRAWNVSRYRAGEWLVDILCLIPIHIAITKENRFVPLKDGVYSSDLERSLLGADVNYIVDSLSFGWYESLFQSYMASKPVKVVSSMGEQSVGKSFALNHLVDTSFAGSAMRTTEGVWMSVTPYPGSIDRGSGFRRGLFRSFQSSSTILDPKSNPSLFQSTLVIIIKDVIESDSVDIVKEFSLKFQRIVKDEQEANFISQLHAGKLNIIPWPVIESRKFYDLFPALKRLLDQQVVTHRAAGEFLHTIKTLMAKLKVETLASHRAQLISMLLPNALAFGLAEIDPEREPLKNLDTDSPVELPDTPYQLCIAREGVGQLASAETTLAVLRTAWGEYKSRRYTPEEAWVEGLSSHLESIVNLRIAHVHGWLTQNLSRFQAGYASIDELRRNFENAVVDLRSNLSGEHKQCTMTAGHAGKHICVVTEHLCGKPCKFTGRNGCLDTCAKVIDHPDEEHLCAAPMHACGKPCDLSDVKLVDGSQYSCPGTCRIARQEHLCTALCSAPGICEIETAPQSIEATFTGRNETFRYTKVRSFILAVDSTLMFIDAVAKRSKCIKLIPPGATMHIGTHSHSVDEKVVHFCQVRCKDCDYFCTSPFGHPQQEHDTRHGSMSRTHWIVDGADDVCLEIDGRKFSTNDEGAPMMCSLVCQAMGRHVHIDYCRADDKASCTGNDEIQHLARQLLPNPDRAKDALTHNLFWKRSGFKDPYSKEEQANFAKCDTICNGPEHSAASGNAALPSYCVLPLFHPPLDPNTTPADSGYISHDGHQFSCRNPVVMQQAFHVIFVADRSSSMSYNDRTPLADTPATTRIRARSNNRFGAVLSSLYSFWTARAAAMASSHAVRRDAYSVVLFDQTIETPIINDFASTPDQLLDILLPFETDLGTDFTTAIQRAQAIMEQNWSTERSPVIIFLSDGECGIADDTMQDLCRTAIRLGKAVSFHSVSFGPDGSSTYLRRMAEIARGVQNNAPRDPLAPAAATVLSSYTRALDTVQLAETFLVIAESLRRPRGALLH
ncbi:hypothetical protein BU15DRAFT_68422 [Melanogaster broomeanus]|nr:hypothetical protein BU15DRAFT_68422 [Melanogaster broomeanus]